MATKAFNAAVLTPKILYSGQLTTTAETTLYTVGSTKGCKVANGTLCNNSAAAVTVSLSLVPSGGTADGTHRIISGLVIAANDTITLDRLLGGHMMGEGDFISAIASVANVLDVVISGAEGS